MRATSTLLLLGFAFLAAPASAQSWPARPLRIIVGQSAGGLADQFARLVAQPLSEVFAQPVVVENRPGANASLATEMVARAKPDGHTLLMAPGSAIVINPHVYSRQATDPLKDLEPIAAVAKISVFLVVKPSLPVKSVADFIALAQAQPGKLNYGSPGVGSSPHIAAEMLKRSAKIEITHVPYKGAGPALADLLGGQIDFWFDPGLGMQHVKAGKLRLLGVGSAKRAALFPEAPTLTEAGISGVDADTWFGLYAPTGLPAEIAKRLSAETSRVLMGPQFRERVTEVVAEHVPMTAREFAALLRADSKRFGALVRGADIRVE